MTLLIALNIILAVALVVGMLHLLIHGIVSDRLHHAWQVVEAAEHRIVERLAA